MTDTNEEAIHPPKGLPYLVRRAFIFWAGFWWLLGFLLLFPFFCLCIWIRRWEPAMAFFNQIWCLLFFTFSFIRVKTLGKKNIPRGTAVIYVSNHGSFLDIPLLTYILPGFPAFMGKASLGKVPVFGYMFRNLHIVVDRGSSQGRSKALKASRKKLAKGRSIIIFPEGSIHQNIQPGLFDFKDGAFKLAIERQVPIVPVTICFNWFILPDDGKWLPNFYVCKSIIHPSVSTIGLTEKDCESLKNTIHKQINDCLLAENQVFLTKTSHAD